MVKKLLYCFKRNDGFIVTPNKPECEYEISYRLIADEGKALTTNGIDLHPVVDTDNPEGWHEVDKPPEVM